MAVSQSNSIKEEDTEIEHNFKNILTIEYDTGAEHSLNHSQMLPLPQLDPRTFNYDHLRVLQLNGSASNFEETIHRLKIQDALKKKERFNREHEESCFPPFGKCTTVSLLQKPLKSMAWIFSWSARISPLLSASNGEESAIEIRTNDHSNSEEPGKKGIEQKVIKRVPEKSRTALIHRTDEKGDRSSIKN
ncbi:hypothetical protein RUM43_001527 [Polyplax serrata]|uniref:Uncharacterized protein n=1 Tax=Polyplax serrata TaxID=468196 RepID=A0AAN8XSA3_POLSC